MRKSEKSVANHVIGPPGSLSVPQLRSYSANLVWQQHQLVDLVIVTVFKPRRRRFYTSRS